MPVLWFPNWVKWRKNRWLLCFGCSSGFQLNHQLQLKYSDIFFNKNIISRKTKINWRLTLDNKLLELCRKWKAISYSETKNYWNSSLRKPGIITFLRFIISLLEIGKFLRLKNICHMPWQVSKKCRLEEYNLYIYFLMYGVNDW